MSSNIHKDIRNGTRDSREQEARDATPIHVDDSILLEDSDVLPKIPPRQGYAQRWVRVARGAEADARNLSLRARRGWLPRAAETVSKDLQYMTLQRQGMGGVIGTHDLVLMERPIEIQRRAEALERNKRRELERAVKTNLFNEHNNLGGASSGFSAPSVVHDSRVERGTPRVAED